MVSRLTGAADLRPHFIERARGRDANPTRKGRAPVTYAAHRPARVIDIFARDRRDLSLGLEPEAWPIGRIGAAGATRLAQRLGCC